MAEITVYPYLSPRIIEILSPTVTISLQELVDLIRAWEDTNIGQHYPFLLDASGKEDLGGGVSVGITAQLQNAQIAFQQRSVSDSNGAVTTLDTAGTTLIDTGATFISDGIVSGDSVYNQTDFSMATVLVVDSETQLQHFPLEGGTGNDWAVSDTYRIWNKIQCEVNGGNLVAVDDVGATASAFLPTAETHVIRTSSSSATLQELDAIQFASFGGGVTVDLDNTTGKAISGTAFPIGTLQAPCDNFIDGLAIANDKGFAKFFVLGDATINGGLDYTGFQFEGESIRKTTFTIDTAAIVTDAEFSLATITGVLDGGAVLDQCEITILNFVNGVISNCLLSGVITLGGTLQADFVNCSSGVAGALTPTIDFGGSGQALVMRNYNGGIKLTNKSGTDACSIDMASGQVIIASSITSGDIIIRDKAKVIDENGNLIQSGTTIGGATLVDETTTKEFFEVKGENYVIEQDNLRRNRLTSQDAADLSAK